MNILLTGGAGFIGAHVARALLDRGDNVVIVDDFNDYYNPDLKEQRYRELVGDRATLYRGDVADREFMAKIGESHQFDAICHLAAQAGVRYSLTNPYQYIQSNVMGTTVVFELARNHNIPHVVYASSSSVYGGNTSFPFRENDPVEQPISLYAATKRSNELEAHTYHHLFGTSMTGLRFFTVYGPWGRPDMALYLFVKAMLQNQPIKIFNNGQMVRNFTYIDDIVAGVVAAIDRPTGNKIYNLGGQEKIPLMTFIESIEKALGRVATKEMLPMQPGDVERTEADTSLAQRELQWQPQTTVDQGIAKTVAWAVAHQDLVCAS